MPEPGRADQVLERLAGRPPGDERVKLSKLINGEPLGEREAPARDPKDVRGQDLSIDPRRRLLGLDQGLCRANDRLQRARPFRPFGGLFHIGCHEIIIR
ncbi:hypothetical protein Prum_030100 [Phytohabitans rumicis]|uniref:Uncharacterized protein n=1 Tax=Phytohabitans rumicis TaxID=1076125 RepID=A0A6V8L335_9ACTN|nr:hypothetical protein Prum_030100 [Phytohabitans rumicis]